MARKRATMREGPLAELFRKTEAAQRAQEGAEAEPQPVDPRAEAALDETVEHVPDFAKEPEPVASAAPVAVPAEPKEDVTAEAAASRAAARYFQTMLEPAPQLHRVPPPRGAAYIATIRVVGVGAGAESLGQFAADVDLQRRVVHLQLLDVGVDSDELDAREPGVDHPVQRVQSGTADADDADHREVGGGVGAGRAASCSRSPAATTCRCSR